MYKNYFKVAVRNLYKSITFSFVHVLGLTIGTAVCLLIFQYVVFERSYDNFHKNAEDIYRVPIRYSEGFSSVNKTAANHPGLGPAMKADFPEVVEFVRLLRPSNIGLRLALSSVNDAGHKMTFMEEQVFLADSTFFEIFSFPVLSGNTSNMLSEPNSIVITREMAMKYFGQPDALGKTLDFYGNNLRVTGVMDNIPANSHLDFDGLLSFTTILPNISQSNSWIWPEFYTYVKLQPGADPAALEAKFPVFTDRYMDAIHKEHNFRTYFSLQPLLDIHLKTDCANEPTVPGSERMVYFLSLLGIFILFIAWVNYINLSTARSLERAKEVATRKVAGADRRQLIGQFLIEAILLNAVSILLGVIIARLLLGVFSDLVGKEIGNSLLHAGLLLDIRFWLILTASILFGGFVAGIYPALVLSSFRPAQILKGSFHKSKQGVVTRKFLVGFQFVLSISLIAITMLVARQLSFMFQKELGYSKEQVVVVKAPTVIDSVSYVKSLTIINEFSAKPEVNSVAKSTEIPGKLIAFRVDTRRGQQGKEFNKTTFLQSVDHQFLSTYNMELIAGRNFGPTDSTNVFQSQHNKILVNEALLSVYGFRSPEEALGQQVLFKLGPNDRPGEIIGVVKNYHQRSLKEPYEPLLFYYPTFGNWGYYSVNLATDDWSGGISKIEETYRDFFPESAFEYFFLDEYFDRQYKDEQRFASVCWVMSVLAIIITCLGLFGLSALVLIRRTKEIGVRKVLGASISRILMLISKDFIGILIIANIIAIPMVVYFGQKWLNGFAYRIGLGWQIFIIPIILLLFVILTIIGIQIYRTSVLNPVRSLRSE